jgi:uncharacterized phage protein gp47/JayE
MSTQTLPLATLAAQITATGISAPPIEDIIASETATYQGIYGSDVVLTPDTQDGQLIAVRSTAINDTNNLAIAVYNSFLPGFSQGVGLSAIVQINGLQRELASNSTVVLNIGGTAGTIIAAGAPTDANGNVWLLPPNTTIPESGTVTVTATAQQAGNITAAAGTVTNLSPIIAGWQSVTNPAPAIPGQAAETDAALRQRQTVSTALPAQTLLSSILASVANSGGIGRFAIYENETKVTNANGQPGNSIAVVVEGGDVTTIAQVIEAKKSPGVGTFGTTSVTVLDPSGVPITINFFELTEVPIFIAMTIQPLNGYVSTTGTAGATAAAAFIAELEIGQEVFLNWVLGEAGLVGTPLGLTFIITSLTIGLSPTTLSSANIPIAFNAAASCTVANVAITTLPAA